MLSLVPQAAILTTMTPQTAFTALSETEATRTKLATALTKLQQSIGHIAIGNSNHFPYGWRKAAKGRTVWRIVEEVINQNLEKHHKSYDIDYFSPSESEVGVYDFIIKLSGDADRVYVNIKSSVLDARSSKDDISKAARLLEFYEQGRTRQLFIATFGLEFTSEPLGIRLAEVAVLPTAWLPDIYVNPSNNGNLQSAHYKKLETAVRRTNDQFISELQSAVEVAAVKRRRK